MSIDKIKHYLGEDLFAHWSSVKDKDQIARAEKQLQSEIDCGLLVGVQYYAELNLLRLLLTP